MRKDAAARAADHMADRESNLGKFIDANTGKIIEQNKALLANERIKARDRAKDAEADYLAARRSITSVSEPGSRIALPPEARAAVARYRAGEGNAASLAANLEAIRKKVDADPRLARGSAGDRKSEEHTSELQSLMRISYAVFCLKKKNNNYTK